MPTRLPPPLDRVLGVLKNLTPVQKIAAGAAVVALVAGGFFLTRGGDEVTMAPLYANLDTADVAGVVDFLNTTGVPYELTDAGASIMVPSEMVYDTRIALSAEGLPSAGGGWSILDDQGITTSAFKQQVDYQRALEAELSNTVSSIDGVKSATVRLALPEDSVFVDESAKPTAAVLVRTEGNRPLDSDQVDGITRLVSSAVRNLDPSDVTVTDSSGNVISAGSGTSGGSRQLSVRGEFETALGSEITTMLSRVTGSDNVSVQVRADMNFDEVSKTSERWEIPEGADEEGLVGSEKTSDESYEGTDAGSQGGILGPDGAIVDDTTDAGAGSTYVSQGADRNFLFDRVIEEVQVAPGQVERLSVAVVLDDEIIDAAQVPEFERLVAAAAGLDIERGDEVVVTVLPFDTSSADAIAEEEAAAQAALDAARSAERMKLFIIIGLLALALIVGLISVWRARRVVAVPLPLDDLVEATPAPAPQPEPVLPTGPTEAELAAEAEAAETRAHLEHQQKLLNTLDEFIDDRPAEVAQLLRTWLNGDK